MSESKERCEQCKGLGYYDEGHECDDGTMAGGNYVDCEKCKPKNQFEPDWDQQLVLLERIKELELENLNLKAYAKHERSLGAEPFAIENNDLKQELQEAKESVSDLRAATHILASERDAAEARLKALEVRKDGAYLERNKLVSLLSKVFPSGKKKTAIEGWSKNWHGCVYIDLPTGQASWHYHDSQSDLFDHLPEYKGTWDGHTTDEKYERIRQFAAGAAPTKEQT